MSLTVTADPPPPPLAADAAVLPGEQPPLTVPSPELGLDTGALADQDGEVGICLLQGYIVLLDEVSGEGRGNDGSPRLSPLGPGKLRAGRYLHAPHSPGPPAEQPPGPDSPDAAAARGTLAQMDAKLPQAATQPTPDAPHNRRHLLSKPDNNTGTRLRRPPIAAPVNRGARQSQCPPASGRPMRTGGRAGRPRRVLGKGAAVRRGCGVGLLSGERCRNVTVSGAGG